MEETIKQSNGKLPYRGPNIVDVGSLAAVTTGATSPATEAGVEVTYYHSVSAPEEVDLDDLQLGAA